MQTFETLDAAAEYAGVANVTIMRWARTYGLGEFKYRQWFIDKDKLDRVLAAKRQIREIKQSLRSMD